MAGREKDLSTGELLTNLAEEEGLIKPTAVRSLRNLIQAQREQQAASVSEE